MNDEWIRKYEEPKEARQKELARRHQIMVRFWEKNNNLRTRMDRIIEHLNNARHEEGFSFRIGTLPGGRWEEKYSLQGTPYLTVCCSFYGIGRGFNNWARRTLFTQVANVLRKFPTEWSLEFTFFLPESESGIDLEFRVYVKLDDELHIFNLTRYLIPVDYVVTNDNLREWFEWMMNIDVEADPWNGGKKFRVFNLKR